MNFSPEMQKIFASILTMKGRSDSVPNFTTNLLLEKLQKGDFGELSNTEWDLKVFNMIFGNVFNENNNIACSAVKFIRQKFQSDQDVSQDLSIDALAKVQVLLTKHELVSKDTKEALLEFFEELSLYHRVVFETRVKSDKNKMVFLITFTPTFLRTK